MKYILLPIFLLSIVQLVAQENVLFGERQWFLSPSENTTRIFLDKEGTIYPDEVILDSELKLANSSIKEFYLSSRETRAGKMSSNNDRLRMLEVADFSLFQKEMADSICQHIQKKLDKETRLVVLIHGFRKSLNPKQGDSSAQEDYSFMKASILENAPTDKLHFIEVYWDGMYMVPKRKIIEGIRLGRMFKKDAVKNAKKVGHRLRKLISGLDVENLDIIVHSLGAEVATNMLLNSKKHNHKTPSQRNIRICLLAPAISKKSLKKYHNRNSLVPFEQQDNYHLTVIYNESDFVLSKSVNIFGGKVEFSRLYGNTRLGCNCRNEALELERYFRKHYPNSEIQLFHADDIGSSHHAKSYFGSNAFKSYVKDIIK